MFKQVVEWQMWRGGVVNAIKDSKLTFYFWEDGRYTAKSGGGASYSYRWLHDHGFEVYPHHKPFEAILKECYGLWLEKEMLK